MKKLLFLLYIIGNISTCLAVPAYPQKIRTTVEDGFVYIYLCGDEKLKYAHTEEGYTILKENNTWYYACINSKGEVQISNHKLRQTKSKETEEFLKNLPKELTPLPYININRVNNVNNTTISRTGNGCVIGERHFLVILMQFTDKHFTKSREDFNALFNQRNYNEDNALGSVHDFYFKNSYQKLNLQSDIIGPFTTKYNMAYYGGNTSISGNDRMPEKMFEEAIEEAAKYIDFSKYDNNDDGYIDGVHIIYAGYGEEAGASSDAIWAHEMQMNPKIVQGLYIDRYSCSPELRDRSGGNISRIGVICHEIGHSLGAADYYDTNYNTDGQYEGTGKWDIMAQGSWNNDGISPADFNPYVKAYDFGWVNVTRLSNGNNTIIPTHYSDTIYRIDTPVKDEFFLLENKSAYEYLPGEGLLIYHINSDIENKAKNNKINAGYPQSCYPVCASSSYGRPNRTPATYGNINSTGCPYPGSTNNTSFTVTSTPSATCTNGINAEIEITDISRKASGNVTLNYNFFDNNDTYNNYIWEEDFEIFTFDENWEIESINNNSTWNIIKYTTQNSTDLYPFKNNGLLKMESGKTNTIIKERTKSKIITKNSIELNNAKDAFLRLHCSINTIGNIPDTVSIFMREAGEKEWKCTKKQELNEANKWIEITTGINAEYKNLEIAFEISVNYASIFYLDAITIEERKNSTSYNLLTNTTEESICIRNHKRNHIEIKNISQCTNNITIYKTDGTIVLDCYLDGEESVDINIEQGLYLIKHNEGCVKILVQ